MAAISGSVAAPGTFRSCAAGDATASNIAIITPAIPARVAVFASINFAATSRIRRRLSHLTLPPGDSKYKCTGGVASSPAMEATMVICPECESDLDIEEDEVDEGEVVSCPECGTDFEIVTVNPLELKPVEELEEDEELEDEESEDGDL